VALHPAEWRPGLDSEVLRLAARLLPSAAAVDLKPPAPEEGAREGAQEAAEEVSGRLHGGAAVPHLVAVLAVVPAAVEQMQAEALEEVGGASHPEAVEGSARSHFSARILPIAPRGSRGLLTWGIPTSGSGCTTGRYQQRSSSSARWRSAASA